MDNKFGHQPLVVFLCVYVRVCIRPRSWPHTSLRTTTHDHKRPWTTTHDHKRSHTTMNDHAWPRTTTNDHARPQTRTGCDFARRTMNGSLWNFYKYVMYNTANNVSTFSMSGTILPTMFQILVVIQLPNKLLTIIKWRSSHQFTCTCHCYPLDGCTMQSGNYPCLPRSTVCTSLSNGFCTWNKFIHNSYYNLFSCCRDLKPSNIFIEGDRIIMGDFGVATVIGDVRTKTRTAVGM